MHKDEHYSGLQCIRMIGNFAIVSACSFQVITVRSRQALYWPRTIFTRFLSQKWRETSVVKVNTPPHPSPCIYSSIPYRTPSGDVVRFSNQNILFHS